MLDSKLKSYLLSLKSNPPPSLILEGGTPAVRLETFKLLAKILNCVQQGCTCQLCKSIDELEARDVYFFSSLETKIENIRELKAILGNVPSLNCRVIGFDQAQHLNLSCANALLKVLEEPPRGNIFVFLVPQRQGMLPTIVSRSFVLNLGAFIQPSLPEQFAGVEEFIRRGKNFFNLKKEKISPQEIEALINFLQAQLILAHLGSSSVYPPLEPNQFYQLSEIFSLSLSYLQSKVNPSLVLDWMLTKVFLAVRQYEERKGELAKIN